MTTQTHALPNNLLINRTLVVGLVLLLAIVLAIGYVWMQTDPAIAPPGLRVMDGLWRLFFPDTQTILRPFAAV
jgi:hypothetical protein